MWMVTGSSSVWIVENATPRDPQGAVSAVIDYLRFVRPVTGLPRTQEECF